MEANSLKSSLAEVQAMIDEHLQRRSGELRLGEKIQVLEAGCGSATQFRLPTDVHMVGIDNSAGQLERNQFITDKILGDLQCYELPESAFDVILCNDVIEHIEHPELALSRMASALREDGILVICAPVRESFKGTLTRLTPFWFHVFVYKYLLRDDHAGEPGHHPFPTYLKREMGRNAIASFARHNGLSIDFVTVYAHNPIYEKLKRTSMFLYCLSVGLGKLVKLLTLGAVTPDISDFRMVLRRTAPALSYTQPGAVANLSN